LTGDIGAIFQYSAPVFSSGGSMLARGRFIVLVLFCTLFQPHLAVATNFQSSLPMPQLTGKLVYHTYKSYGDGSAQLYLYDFAQGSLRRLSQPSWNIIDPMNADISADGSTIVFMGIQDQAWNIFMWRLDSEQLPVNLTKSHGETMNEDPKFSADGKNIVFKRSGEIYQMEVRRNVLSVVAPRAQDKILSMPYLSADSSLLYFSVGDESAASVYVKDLKTNSIAEIDSTPGSRAYYPIVRHDGTLFYTRHVSGTDDADQIYMKGPAGPPRPVIFNDPESDNSDPAPVEDHYLIYSNTSESEKYQLVLGDLDTGERWSLSPLGLNLSEDVSKLGARYWAPHPKILVRQKLQILEIRFGRVMRVVRVMLNRDRDDF